MERSEPWKESQEKGTKQREWKVPGVGKYWYFGTKKASTFLTYQLWQRMM